MRMWGFCNVASSLYSQLIRCHSWACTELPSICMGYMRMVMCRSEVFADLQKLTPSIFLVIRIFCCIPPPPPPPQCNMYLNVFHGGPSKDLLPVLKEDSCNFSPTFSVQENPLIHLAPFWKSGERNLTSWGLNSYVYYICASPDLKEEVIQLGQHSIIMQPGGIR